MKWLNLLLGCGYEVRVRIVSLKYCVQVYSSDLTGCFWHPIAGAYFESEIYDHALQAACKHLEVK